MLAHRWNGMMEGFIRPQLHGCRAFFLNTSVEIMHIRLHSLFLSFILVAGAGDALAQRGSVAGRVEDGAGRPLEGAAVVLEQEGRPRFGAATDTDGTFAFLSVRPGTYEVTASYLGYEVTTRNVDVQPGQQAEVTITLVARALPQDEVTVTATRARRRVTPITFSNMTARDLEEQPAMKDLPVLLSTRPSITHHSENGNGIGYSTLRMRGFDQRRIAISVNGIPQNDPEDFNVFWINFFDLQGSVEDVQIQRGAGSSVYGPTAIGGAINIVARPYRPYPYAEAEIAAGSYATRRFTAEANSGLLGERYVAHGRFSRLLSDGYRDWSWTEFYRFFAGVTRYGDRSTLTLQAYGGPQRDGLAFSGIPKAANAATVGDGFGGTIDRTYNFSALSEDVEHFHQPHIELLHDWDISPRVSAHQAIFGVKGEGYFDFGGTFRSADYLRLPAGFRDLSAAERTLPLFVTAPDVSLQFRAYLDQWQVGWLPHVTIRHAGGETTLGAEARLHRSLRWGRIQEASGIPDELVGGEHDVRVYSFRGEKAIGSVYARHLWRIGTSLALQGDVQLTYRHYRVFDEAFFGRAFKKPYVFVNPRLGMTLFPERPLSAYVSIALAHREPRLKSLYDGEEAGAGFTPRFQVHADGTLDTAHPLISHERLLDIEAGAALDRRSLRATANLFWMEFRDEIVPSGGLDQFGVPRSGNADRTRHIGLEMEATLRAADWIDLYANATLSRNRFIDFVEFVVRPDGAAVAVVRDGNPIAGFPEQMANLGLRLHAGGWVLRIGAQTAGKQYIDNSGARLADGSPSTNLVVDPYTLVNASLQYEPGLVPGLRLAADVNNVLDDEVLLYGNVGPAGPQFFPTATRHVLLSVRYRIR